MVLLATLHGNRSCRSILSLLVLVSRDRNAEASVFPPRRALLTVVSMAPPGGRRDSTTTVTIPTPRGRSGSRRKFSTSNRDETTVDEEDRQQLLYNWLVHNDASFHDVSPVRADAMALRLLHWYRHHRRKLPWRGDPPPWNGSTANVNAAVRQKKKKRKSNVATIFTATTVPLVAASSLTCPQHDAAIPVTPYGIWVSEIMLQQTRVEAVIDYWRRWMHQLPTVQDLAAADATTVNALWAGLGLYRRARHLHQAAQIVVHDHAGIIPVHDIYLLQQLPGIGRYTATALASICQGTALAAVDGNVCRVLCRLQGIAQAIAVPALKNKQAWPLAQALMDAAIRMDGTTEQQHPHHVNTAGDWNQAMMELGATYCAPTGTGCDPNDPLRDCYWSVDLGLAVAAAHADATLSIVLQQAEANISADAKTPQQCCTLCAQHGVQQAMNTMVGMLEDQSTGAVMVAPSECLGHAALPLAAPAATRTAQVWAVLAASSLSSPSSPRSSRDEQKRYLLIQRPSTGLLATQWEFPSVLLWESTGRVKAGTAVPTISAAKRKQAFGQLQNSLGIMNGEHVHRKTVPEPVEHVFSHVRHVMWIESVTITANNINNDATSLLLLNAAERPARWMTANEMQRVGVTAGVRKVLRAVQGPAEPTLSEPEIKTKKRKRDT